MSSEIDELAEAEDYHLQATFVLNELQANIEVYGSNSILTGATPANVDLALKYIERSLEYFPENTNYLNTKALLLAEGKGEKDAAIILLEKAHKLNPRDINIESNLNGMKSSGCFIATAAYGSPLVWQINVLRTWRREVLLKSKSGRLLIHIYNKYSPPIASIIAEHRWLRIVVKFTLKPIIYFLTNKYPPHMGRKN